MNTIISPLITEKSTQQIDSGLYVFVVSPKANKNSLAQEIESLYKIKPISIRIVNLPAKRVTFKRIKGIRNERRKAYIQLPPKTSLPGFETLKQGKEAEEKAANKKKEETK